LLPEGTSPDLVTRFEQGGVAPGGVATIALARIIEPTLYGSSTRVFVAENALAKRTDPTLEAEPVKRFSLGEELYEYVRAVGAGRDQIASVLRLADAGYSLNAIVSTIPTSSVLPEHRGDAGIEIIDQMALNVELVAARAYDGEGYVVWSTELPA
jgi:hypothetical protein